VNDRTLQTAGLFRAGELTDPLDDLLEESMAYRWTCADQRFTFARFGPTTPTRATRVFDTSVDPTEAG
jgi:hypothetical protein